MNDWLQGMILAVVQGLTEFLPISSSAHLVLPAQVLGWPDQGLAFDVAVHVGSLLAVILYFRADLFSLATGSVAALRTRHWNHQASMVFYLFLGTIPVGLAGLLLDGWIEAEMRSVAVIASTTILFGLLLGWADQREHGQAHLNIRIACLVGLAQALAIIPGTSRSGVTMTVGLLCGLDRQTAARFSFLLSIPVIAAAGLLKTMQLAALGEQVPWGLLLSAALLAGLTAYACIAVFLRLLDRVGLMPFVIYRCLLGILLFYLWW